MDEKWPIVPVTVTRAEEMPREDPSDPRVGRWYWVKDTQYDSEAEAQVETKWFGCIIQLGSNFAELRSPQGHVTRVHLDSFWDWCEFVPNPDEVIKDKIGHYQGKVHALMERVREITARLAITPGLALPSGSETQALALRGTGQNIDEYKQALVLAKDETLPKLFEKIKHANASLGKWLTAELIPLKAQADGMHPAIEAIKNRIFSVELYAGLTEDVEQIAEGEPAPLTEKIHLMQRRAYMDEECLAQYEIGGMEFKDISEFDAWLARPKNRDRLLPFPRCIVAFRVRRGEKHREWGNLAEFVRMLEDVDADKTTFLYIRNGEQLFRLSTTIEFDAKLFPDMDQQKLAGPLYVKMFTDRVDNIISENEWKGMVEDEESRIAKAKTVPEKDRWRYDVHFRESERYEPFNRENVYYDDISKHIQEEMNKHNRLVLVLQGLLDRSPVLHPHPPWALWTQNGFEQALTLIYDDARALVAGPKPDFEAYRARLNSQLKAGSITVGQERDWERQEAIKENRRMDRDYRHKRSDYRPTYYRPYGNPGPGTLARVVKYSRRMGTCTYEWTRQRMAVTYDNADQRIRCGVQVKASQLLNIDAYKPGDFHQFFDDPRTRAEYLKWAPFLLLAEEYHAGNRQAPPPLEKIPRRKTEDGSWKYRRRKALKALMGKAVRLDVEVETRGGIKYPKGSLWRVVSTYGGEFDLRGILDDGTDELTPEGWVARGLRKVGTRAFTVDPSVPAPKAKDETKDPNEEA